jgi:hypothetical protein
VPESSACIVGPLIFRGGRVASGSWASDLGACDFAGDDSDCAAAAPIFEAPAEHPVVHTARLAAVRIRTDEKIPSERVLLLD